MTQRNPREIRAWRIRTRRQDSVPIPAGVLAEALETGVVAPLIDFLGLDMITAIHEAVKA